MSQTGDSGRRGERRRKMMEGMRETRGSRWTGIIKEAAKPYLSTTSITSSKKIMIRKWCITRNLPKSSKIVKMFEERKSELLKKILFFLNVFLP